MRELSADEVDRVSGADMRSVAIGIGRTLGAGAGALACVGCGPVTRTLAGAAVSELGGSAAGYVYDNPAKTLSGAVRTLVVVDAMSSFAGAMDPVGAGEGGTPAADPTSW